MTAELRSVLIGTAGLSVAAGIALALTLARGGVSGCRTELRAARRTAIVATLLQAAHFGEELATGFHHRLPELLGLAPWSPRFFVSFNLVWLAIWIVSIRGLAVRNRAALFPLWFLGLAGAANGIAHPLLAVRVGAYFPGLYTSPVVAVAGIRLLRDLLHVTGGGRR